MTVKELIEQLGTLPPDMEVGATNYYGVFGPVVGTKIERIKHESWHEQDRTTQEAVILRLDLDMQ